MRVEDQFLAISTFFMQKAQQIRHHGRGGIDNLMDCIDTKNPRSMKQRIEDRHGGKQTHQT
jgi:hypothetical protein